MPVDNQFDTPRDAMRVAGVARYYEILLKASETQNLTRQLSEEDFENGHLLDSIELLRSGFLEGACFDLGSGAGVPGLICALLEPKIEWVLCESEGRKAEFLSAAVSELGLNNVQVTQKRAEKALLDRMFGSITARAVGKVEKIFGLIEKCSTWNNLILFKSRGWEEEWNEFQKSKHKNKLKIVQTHTYNSGPEQKYRLLIKLERNR